MSRPRSSTNAAACLISGPSGRGQVVLLLRSSSTTGSTTPHSVPQVRAMVVKEFRELMRDRRTLAMLIVMPLLLLVIFGYAANFYVSSVKTAVLGPDGRRWPPRCRRSST